MYLIIIDNILICQQIQSTNVSTLIGSSSVHGKNNDKNKNKNENKTKLKIERSGDIKHVRSNYKNSLATNRNNYLEI